MRILTVCSSLGRGGTQRVAQNFSLAYHRLGHPIAVLAYNEGGVRRAPLEAAGIPVIIGSDTSSIEAVDAFAPDVIHIHRNGMANPFETDLMQRLKPAGSDRRLIETNVFARIDLSSGNRLIDVHFQLTNWCMWKWRQWLGSRRHKTAGVVIPNAVDIGSFNQATLEQAADFRAQHEIPSGAFLCGRVGQPEPGKWHPANLDAFADLAAKDPEAHLVVLGLPPSFQPQINAMPALIRDRIRVLPVTDSDDTLRALYGSIDCFLHAATTGESFGLVLTEAMLCGAPVVTASRPHKDNSQIEVVRHGVDGMVAGSVKHLGAALFQLRQSAELRQKIRENVREGVISRFESNAVAAKAICVMEHALANGDRYKLIAALESDARLKTHTTDAEAMQMLKASIGAPDRRELFKMRLMHRPLVHRAAQLYLRMTLYRRLQRQFAKRPASK